MIDFIKINDLSIGLDIQNYLDFEMKFIEQTGEILVNKKKSANLKNLIFTIVPEGRFVKVQGSLHKFSNNGERNNDRFTFERFQEVCADLKEYIAPNDIINNLEFGVNICTPFNPSDFIKNLLAHRKKQFNKTLNPGKSIAQAEYSQFILKIYDKSLHQGPMGANILRIELKYLTMQKLFKDRLKWKDLSKPETWHYLGSVLQKKFGEVTYYDPSIDLKSLSESDRKIIEKGHNPIFFENLSGPHASRIRKQYQNLISKHDKKFKILPELLTQEINEVVKSYHFSTLDNEMPILTDFYELVKSYPLLYGNISPSVI